MRTLLIPLVAFGLVLASSGPAVAENPQTQDEDPRRWEDRPASGPARARDADVHRPGRDGSSDGSASSGRRPDASSEVPALTAEASPYFPGTGPRPSRHGRRSGPGTCRGLATGGSPAVAS